ncbi:hypothetical protein PHYSODRAFT_298206 [Phytophthora sojae]|uniref:Acyl-coenzyme A oxidase n=1 Tax=Phytophthora sojae (strain P6497) TaxID=1094619 RepID=G4Z9V2_PHYSP|nr:hypothetical protein PHYSODRAFT_298206 [Phytophthora sojae]EGZ19805.1 hypothetical protein PHYSODRAFT_298206 [Phytophthora sojae]|eukprot:XP_009522522.1 hypothetical protein PHYSODRAFT_298206 [Phytophthora sojae]
MAVELKDLAPLLLKKERANGDIDPAVLTDVLRDGKAANDRRKQLVKVIEDHPVLSDRDMMFRNHTQRYEFGLKKAFHYVKLLQEGGYTDPVDQQILYKALAEPLGFDVHRAIRKWWPGGLGKTANHAIVHARLFLDGKDVGVQAFLVQLRSLEDHQPLPGIEVGDIGPKVGFNAIDNGYCAFHKIRTPRENMMMRYAKVLPDGTFVKPKSDKLVYLTMVQVRAYMIKTAGLQLGAASTICTRFSAARIQGRTPDNKGEFQVLDYQNQQHKLFPLIAISYAAHFAGTSLVEMHDSAVDIIKSGGSSFGAKLAELHAVSSGLKAWLAERVSDGVETCRRLCGGHGFTQSSNLAHLFAEIVGANTYEGTFDVLVQQHARYLLKTLGSLPVSENSTKFLNQVKQYSDTKLRCKAQTSEDFGDLDLLLEAFQTRAARIVLALANQMKAAKNDGNACMVFMTRASTAHAELILLEAFIRGVKNLPPGAEKNSLTQLCSLFGVWLITNSLGDFRQLDYISSHQVDLVREQIVRLLPVIRKNCVLLTDAWDFSDFELNSTIGRYDGDIYRALVKRAADEPLNKTQVPEGYEKYLKPLIQSDL